ncbi:hypothetical protein J7E97_08300 [Streptomyces sp. ISL-66]|uniref:hypothetical protein n=1 Tax=Streptomyces sp. ISL-66 TaxID=2819186 RepID=UPI001BE77E9D|nr:hypothetical protein [Streptomyces sp. ISL-66]MBT2467875.1 hypothetical protein [Streptomyces sp. ISL-66]
MPPVLIPVILLELLYAAAVVTAGSRPGAPLWLRWPYPIWNFILNGPRPAALLSKPDYRRIAQLECELGLAWPVDVGGPRLGVSSDEALAGVAHLGRQLRAAADAECPVREEKVCLVKGCDGATEELRNWAGMLLRRVHRH